MSNKVGYFSIGILILSTIPASESVKSETATTSSDTNAIIECDYERERSAINTIGAILGGQSFQNVALQECISETLDIGEYEILQNQYLTDQMTDVKFRQNSKKVDWVMRNHQPATLQKKTPIQLNRKAPTSEPIHLLPGYIVIKPITEINSN